MKKQTKAAAQAAQANQSATAQVTNAQAGAKYLERMHVNKSLCTSSPKHAYKLIFENSAIPSELLTLAVESASYISYLQHMKKRHNIKEEDKTTSPKRGWSVWYALEWAEKQVKQAAEDKTHPAHAKAVEYLRKTRAELQAMQKDIF